MVDAAMKRIVLLLLLLPSLAFAQPVKPPINAVAGPTQSNQLLSIIIGPGGAKGDGTADDSTEIATAIAAVAAGGTLYFPAPSVCYKITSPIVVAKSLTLLGQQSTICQAATSTAGIAITASNVKLNGLVLVGPGSASFASGSNAITASGTFNAGVAPTYISDVEVTNVSIRDWNEVGILASYVRRFYAQGNTIKDVNYGGLITTSVSGCRIVGNTVDTVVGNGASPSLAYGIALSRDTSDSGELTSQPRTSDCTVVGNVLKNVPTWEAIDTHGGERISVVGNVIYNAKNGISIGSANNSSGTPTYAPLDVTVTGNSMDSAVTDGSAGYGITFQGIAATQYATGSVSGNVLKGYGDQSSAITGALQMYGTSGLSVTGNTFINSSPIAINVYHDNVGYSVSGNTIVDVWSNTALVGEAVGIETVSGNNTGAIGGNSITTNGFSATYLLTTATGKAIRIGDVSGNSAQVGENYSTATTYLHDSGNRASIVLPPITTSNGGVLGTAAFQNTGTSGATVPLLNGTNTASGTWTFTNATSGWSVSANQNATTSASITNTDMTNTSSKAALLLTGGNVLGAIAAIHSLGLNVGTNSDDDLGMQVYCF